MPTYLLHGFRWPRPLIRIHIILQNLEDAAAEWLIAPATTETLISNFHSLYPALMPSLQDLRFIEQYDPSDESVESKSQPYAYVADFVTEVKLGVDLDECRAKGIPNETWSSMVELRDKLAPGEKLSWFVVVCGDTERWAPPAAESSENASTLNGYTYTGSPSNGSQQYPQYSQHQQQQQQQYQQQAQQYYQQTNNHGGSGSAETGRGQNHGLSSPRKGDSTSTSNGGESRFSSEAPRPSTSRSLKKMFSFKKVKGHNTENPPPLPPPVGYNGR